MKHFYVYYSYEEFGRGYIGKRECKCLPINDIRYFGSFSDKSFRPTQKIIIATFESGEEALEAEIILHEFYQVDINPHFVNRSKQLSKKFYYNKGPGDAAIQRRIEMMKTDRNPMSNPLFREKARQNLIESLKDPTIRKQKSESAKLVFNDPVMREKRRQIVIQSHKNPETKRKHIEAKLGEKNPCYGKRWITNGIENRYIDSTDTLPNGYVYGRKLNKDS